MTARNLMRRARALWPHSRTYRKQWVRSVLSLGRRWILAGGEAKWGHGGRV